MLAWHLPHQLAAELVLVGVSAAVLLYSLLPWGKNQWLRTHGVILCGYYAVVALFVLLVVFLATGTPPGAPDGALAD